ncbi:adenosine kinase [Legionella hackeliae]|uniref:Putative enzyme n=1 Tax=Legionella hackeliae TaxID=449 RepID=A0A0A8UUB2_LEGHA|nr:adenosine kinase [Legionella hackeliae]KTD13938.1 IolC/IolB transferase kinase protein [Legionella hackeliae]CEK10642.1 putative enzyme [Legionella hackeliae]STX47384.1 IolC/IolB transferase kinase protein [Legionella hackeliae]
MKEIKKYHVYGIGNALLDRDAKVDEALLSALNIEKGVMTLTDEATHQRLLTALTGTFCHSGCGGSAANSMIALSQFGGRGFYSCKVADDEEGHLFLKELSALGIDCNLNSQNLSPGITGQCLVLVTDDAQRTMNTHLGISESLCTEVLNLDAIAAADYLYLEGYLVTSPTARNALLVAKRHAKTSGTKVALTLSDANIVRYFKNDLLSVIDGHVDLLFCNQEEALLFTDTNDLEAAIALLQPLTRHLIVTCGSLGAIVAVDGEILSVPTMPMDAVDSVGAGDMFAGAYLYAITHGYAPQLATVLANRAAAEVVGQYGARLKEEQVLAIKEEFIANHYGITPVHSFHSHRDEIEAMV